MIENKIAESIKKVRQHAPLIHNIMNYVTINDCANILLAIGASPIMADAPEETAEITAISKALVLNTGTLKAWTKDSMIQAGKMANQMGIPVILDPVGASISKLRRETVQHILEQVKISVIRGNYSEIAFMSGEEIYEKGVDCLEETSFEKGIQLAKKAAHRWNTVVALTGQVDVITDGNCQIQIKNGTSMLAKVTGTGCMTTALIGAFLAEEDEMTAAATGIAVMGIAGEIAEKCARMYGTGSFKVALIDAVSNINETMLKERIKIEKK